MLNTDIKTYAAEHLFTAQQEMRRVLANVADGRGGAEELLRVKAVLAGAEVVSAAADSENPVAALNAKLLSLLLNDPTLDAMHAYSRAVKTQTIARALHTWGC